VSFRSHHTLTGYARTAVDLKARMDEHVRGAGFREFLNLFLDTRLPTAGQQRPSGQVAGRVADTVSQAAGSVWRIGEPFVLAPAMTAIVAAAAQALDLTGEVVAEQVAPSDWGVLFLPEPIYHRNLDGSLSGMAAITWAPVTSQGRGRMWLICAWAERGDPQDPHAARVRAAIAERPELSAMLGPYVLTDLADLVIGVPVPARADVPEVDEPAREWETSPEGRYVIAERDAPTRVCAAILYAFWRIATQPLSTVARAPLDRAGRRRAARARVNHDTRVVMLRRQSPGHDPGSGLEPRWRYRVRFVVRGHWRRMHDRDGNPYRIWIHAYIKGPTALRCCTGRRSRSWPADPTPRGGIPDTNPNRASDPDPPTREDTVDGNPDNPYPGRRPRRQRRAGDHSPVQRRWRRLRDRPVAGQQPPV
jgi:hypothetical protein